MRVKVSLRLEVSFEEGEDASHFYRALKPDFPELDISLAGDRVSVVLKDLPPSRARALANSILRTVQLFQRMAEAFT